MSEQHTKGPWRTAGQGNSHKELPILRPDGQEIGCIRGQARLADARLIAAAPELLETLKEAERVILWAVQESRDRVKSEIVGGWEHHANAIRAAIAKATE